MNGATINLDNVRKWTGALRSGEFKQVDGTLAKQGPGEDQPRYCCLGVGCVVAGTEVVSKEVDEECNGCGEDPCSCLYRFYFGEGGAEELPPIEFHKWLGTADDEFAKENKFQTGDVFLDVDSEFLATIPNQGAPIGPKRSMSDKTDQPQQWSCSNLNDSFKLTFEQIADMIDYFGVKPLEPADI